MEQTIYFCKKWAFSHREAIGLLTPKQALALHQKGKCYSILVDSNTRPSCVVDVFEHKDNKLKFIDVSFLDGLLRRYLIYSFRENETGRLFLRQISYWEYQGATDEGLSTTTQLTGSDGIAKVSKWFYDENGQMILETFNIKVDLAPMYCDFPEFGEYDDLIRLERK